MTGTPTIIILPSIADVFDSPVKYIINRIASPKIAVNAMIIKSILSTFLIFTNKDITKTLLQQQRYVIPQEL